MPVYKYVAKDIKGHGVRGRLEAPNAEVLAEQVRARGEYLLSYEAVDAQGGSQKLGGRELADFNRQLGTMLSSGITLMRAFEIILRRDLPRRQRDSFERIYNALLSGRSLSEAMEQQGRMFPRLLINMYRAGEANGTLDTTALRMADHYEKEYRLQSKIRSAATYPVVLLVITVAVIVLIFTVVVPNFQSLYGDMELPLGTRIVLAASRLFSEHLLFVVLGAVLLVALIQFALQCKPVRLVFDRLKLRLPVLGRSMRLVVTARFARTLSSLYASGLSILTALDIAKGTVGNAYIASQFDDLIESVRTGNSLAASLERIDGFDKKLAATVAVGEESGRLESILTSVADSFDYEANEAAQRMVSVLEPALIVVMALVVGGVLISVIMPIYGAYDQIGASYGIADF